jgi:hypothetical protein
MSNIGDIYSGAAAASAATSPSAENSSRDADAIFIGCKFRARRSTYDGLTSFKPVIFRPRLPL